MEGVYEAVVDRLAMLGYTVTDADETGLKYTIRKCEAELLANINHRKLPPPLFYILGASDGASNAESRFDAMLAQLMHPAESTLAAFRRLRW